MDRDELLDRLTRFAVRIVKMSRALPKDAAGQVLGRQVIRSGTSIVANLEEAIGCASRKEFLYRYSIAAREARETMRWLIIIKEAELLPSNKLTDLLREADEIVAILTSSIRTMRMRTTP